MTKPETNAEISKSEKYNFEDYLKYSEAIKNRISNNIEDMFDGWENNRIRAKMAFAMNKINYLDTFESQAVRDVGYYKRQYDQKLANTLGINIDDINKEEYKQRVEEAKELDNMKIFEAQLKKAQKKSDDYYERMAQAKNVYLDLEKQSLDLVNGMNSKINQGTAQLVGGIIEGMLDVKNMATNVAITYMTGGLASGFALGKASKFILTNALNFADTYFYTKEQSELLDRKMTKEQLMENAIANLLLQNGVSLAIKGVKNIFFKGAGNISDVRDLSIPETKSSITTPKEIGKAVYDLSNPNEPTANQQLFARRIQSGEEYSLAFSPYNERTNILEGMTDYKLGQDPSNIYQLKNSEVVKMELTNNKIEDANFDFQRGIITKEEYDNIVFKEQQNLRQKVETGVNVVESFDMPEDTAQVHKYDIVNVPTIAPMDKRIINFSSNYDETLKALQSDEVPYFTYGYIHTNKGDYTTFKVEDGTLVQVFLPSGTEKIPYDVNRSNIENTFNRINNIRVMKLDKDNNVKNVLGGQKIEYLNKISQIEKDKICITRIVKLAEGYQDINNYNMNNKGKDVITGNPKKSVRNISDALITEQFNNSRNISNNIKYKFKELLGKYFTDRTDFVKQINNNAYIELLLSGDTDKPLFKNPQLNTNEIKKAIISFNQHLLNLDNITQTVQKRGVVSILFDDPNIKERYGMIFKQNSDGIYEFNTSEGGFFYNKDVDVTVLDLLINPLDVVDGKYSATFTDRDMINVLIGKDYPVERMNGLLVDIYYKDKPEIVDVLKNLGIVKLNNVEENTVLPIDFLNGINNILKEIENPNSTYDKNVLQSILNDFSNFSNSFPKKIVINEDGTKGTVAYSMYDFILNNKMNGTINKQQIQSVFKDTINIFKDIVDYHKMETNNKLNALQTNEQIKKIDTQSAIKGLSILNKWNKVFNSKQEKANAYMETKVFEKEKADLLKIIKSINETQPNLIDEKIIDNFIPQKYNGNLTSMKLFSILKGSINNVTQTTKNINSYIKDIENVLKNNTNTTDSKFLNSLDTKDYLKNTRNLLIEISENINPELLKDSKIFTVENGKITKILYPKDISWDKATQKKYVKQLIKELRFFNKQIEKKVMSLNFDNDSSLLNVINKTREREKLIKYLDLMYDKNDNTYKDIIDFIDYTSGRYDYKLPKGTIKEVIKNVSETINTFKDDVSIENYNKRQVAYNNLIKNYDKLSTILKNNINEKSISFFSKTDLDKLIDDIKTLNKELGITDDKIDIIYKELNNYKKIIDVIKESQNNSPLKNMQKNLIEENRRLTTNELNKFGLLEALINKKYFLNNKGMYLRKLDGFEKDIKIDNVIDTPKGVFEKYIAPKYQDIFKKLYDNTIKYFIPIEEFDANGNLISSRPMNLDEFTSFYYNFLTHLTHTTRINKVLDGFAQSQAIEEKGSINLGTLKMFFNNEDDMIKFFTSRSGDYGLPYLKDSPTIMYLISESNANLLSQYYTFGSTGLGFASRLNLTNPIIKSMIANANKEIGRDEALTLTSSLMNNLRERLVEYYTGGGRSGNIKGVTIDDLEGNINNFLNLFQNIILAGSGAGEVLYSPIRVANTILKLDAQGNLLGYGDRKNLGFAISQLFNIVKATEQGAATTTSILSQSITEVYNLLNTLANISGLNDVFKEYFGKEINFELKENMTVYDILSKIPSNSEQSFAIRILSDWFDTESLRHARGFQLADAKNVEQYGGQQRKVRQIFGAFNNTIGTIGVFGQRQAEMIHSLNAFINVRKLITDMSTTPYANLPNDVKSSLGLFGINEKNYIDFISTLNYFKDSNGTFNNVNLFDLSQSIDSKELLKLDSHFVDAIQSFCSYRHDKASNQNPDARYEHNINLFNRIATIFRKTTASLGFNDVQSLFYLENSDGTISSKFDLFTSGKLSSAFLLSSLIMNPILFLTYAIVGKQSKIFDTIAKGGRKLKRKLSELVGEILTLNDILNSDDDTSDKTFKFFGQFVSSSIDDVGGNFPVSSVLHPSDITGSITRSVQNNTSELIYAIGGEKLPDNQITRKFLSTIGYDIQKDIGTTSMQNYGNLTKTMLGASILRIPIRVADTIIDWNKVEDMKKDIKFLEQDPNTSYRAREAYFKLSKTEKIKSLLTSLKEQKYSDEKINNIQINVPPFELLTDEAQVRLGMVYYNDYINNITNSSNAMIRLFDGLEVGINEIMYHKNMIDDKEYKNRQLDFYKDLNMDKIIKRLPNIYQHTIKQIEKANSNLSELESLELKNAILTSIKNGADISLIKSQFMPEDNNKKNKVPIKKYNSFEELPYIYKYKAKQILNSMGTNTKEQIEKVKNDMLQKANKLGQDISKEDVINLANKNYIVPQVKENVIKNNSEPINISTNKNIEENFIDLKDDIKSPEFNDINKPKDKINTSEIQLDDINNISQYDNINEIDNLDNKTESEISFNKDIVPKEASLDLKMESENEKARVNKEHILDSIFDKEIINQDKEKIVDKKIKENKYIDDIKYVLSKIKNSYEDTIKQFPELAKEIINPTPKENIIKKDNVKNNEDYYKFIAQKVFNSSFFKKIFGKKDKKQKPDFKEINKIEDAVDNGKIILNYGENISEKDGTQTIKMKNKGIRIEANPGSPVRTLNDGEVIFSEKLKHLGNIIMIDYGDNIGVYSGLISMNVKRGDKVNKGERIGVLTINKEGKSILDYELRKDAKYPAPQSPNPTQKANNPK